MKIILSFSVILFIIMAGLNVIRNIDELRRSMLWDKFEKSVVPTEDIFTPDKISHLPTAVQKYFTYMIKPGTPLKKYVKIDMQGQIGLGPKAAPDYMDMTASQIMSLEIGYIWSVKTGRGPMIMTGSDGLYKRQSWSRFWLMHSIPAGRAGGFSKASDDHRRAAFGRLAAETAFWSPAALLSERVSWETLSDTTVRATITYEGLTQTVDIFMDEHGQPIKIIIPRWSDANPENTYQSQPFGGYLSVYKDFDGYKLPTHIEGGNFIGTDDYYPFYITDVKSLIFMD